MATTVRNPPHICSHTHAYTYMCVCVCVCVCVFICVHACVYESGVYKECSGRHVHMTICRLQSVPLVPPPLSLPHALSPSILSRSLQHVINVAMRKRALLAQASLLAHARSRARTGPQTTLGRLFTFVTITGGIVVFTQGLAFTDERLAFSVQLGFRV